MMEAKGTNSLVPRPPKAQHFVGADGRMGLFSIHLSDADFGRIALDKEKVVFEKENSFGCGNN